MDHIKESELRLESELRSDKSWEGHIKLGGVRRQPARLEKSLQGQGRMNEIRKSGRGRKRGGHRGMLPGKRARDRKGI